MAKRELTEKQAAFIACLFDEDVGGNYREAARKAGYSDNVPVVTITNALKDEIIEATKDHIVRAGPLAAAKLHDVLINPAQLGARNTLQGVKEILDRIGVVKPEKIEVEASGGVMILPAKASTTD